MLWNKYLNLPAPSGRMSRIVRRTGKDIFTCGETSELSLVSLMSFMWSSILLLIVTQQGARLQPEGLLSQSLNINDNYQFTLEQSRPGLYLMSRKPRCPKYVSCADSRDDQHNDAETLLWSSLPWTPKRISSPLRLSPQLTCVHAFGSNPPLYIYKCFYDLR